MGIDVNKAIGFALNRLKGNPLFYLLGAIAMLAAFIVAIPVISIMLNIALSIFGFVATSGGGSSMSGMENGGPQVNLQRILFFAAKSMICDHLAVFASASLILAPLQTGYCRGISREADGGKATVYDFLSGFKDGFSILIFSCMEFCNTRYIILDIKKSHSMNLAEILGDC